ncbi:NCS2 family permease [Paenibacillus ehimensis]|uniref:NCS2 family permease n=1 Tax=Paenibacillus ehimensis TaxID=79264 RepID=UPI000470A0FF|nr:NCS2 family permease [Paenibacillus ehimensis]MEC0208107.1 NCS2 family permease [Paenibacillus ehimensis]
MLTKRFLLQQHGTTVRTEMTAGVVSFVTAVYIVAVNASILADAGIPYEAGVIATALAACIGSWLVGFWANSPLVIVPGMGINALFSYTIVQGMRLPWPEALAAVFVSGLIVSALAFTPLVKRLAATIPDSLKHAIGAGVGLFLAFIGLQKGGIVVPGSSSIVALGDFGNAHTLLTLATLAVTLALYVRGVPGNLLIGIAAGTGLAAMTGQLDWDGAGTGFSLAAYGSVFGAMSFSGLPSVVFWTAVFSFALVVLFENIGLIDAQLRLIGQPEKAARSLQAGAVSVAASGVLGTSPTVTAVESAAGISSGGRTGLTAVTAGALFACAVPLGPFMRLIPDSAIAPVLIVIGGLMLQGVKDIPFDDLSEWLPAFLIVAGIPLTSSIVDGMGLGFVAFPILKLAAGKRRDISPVFAVIAALFVLNFALPFI